MITFDNMCLGTERDAFTKKSNILPNSIKKYLEENDLSFVSTTDSSEKLYSDQNNLENHIESLNTQPNMNNFNSFGTSALEHDGSDSGYSDDFRNLFDFRQYMQSVHDGFSTSPIHFPLSMHMRHKDMMNSTMEHLMKNMNNNINRKFSSFHTRPPLPPKTLPTVVRRNNIAVSAARNANRHSLQDHKHNQLLAFYTGPRIPHQQLKLSDMLGQGNFGYVVKGLYRNVYTGVTEKVAVKALPPNVKSNSKFNELVREAQTLFSVQQEHIISLIGVCSLPDSNIMVVLELAPLGELHQYLLNNPLFSLRKIMNICYQISTACEYLSLNGYVHRDIAARNVLLMNETYAKLTDFGLARQVGPDGCFKCSLDEGVFPLKAYPPEVMCRNSQYYGRFDEKTDIWSFATTIWEATSYGRKPFDGISFSVMYQQVSSGYRLPKPSRCPTEVYSYIQHCWRENRNERPSFSFLRHFLSKYSLTSE
ncbi:hypothetical protein SNEBB_003396 [Seison nebaliae]|nr:hypothetical protein SNEBB_003396 [Seison nebaliae]